MEEKYKLLLFKFLYNYLGLQDFELLLKNNNIDYIARDDLMSENQKQCYGISKYFYLLNEIETYYLTSDEQKFLMNVDINGEMHDKVEKFIMHTIDRVLSSNDQNDIIYYGPHSDAFMARSNQIAIGLKVEEFGFVKEKLKELDEINLNDKMVNEIISQIESKGKRWKIKVIKYNELFEKLSSSSLNEKKHL